MRCLLLLTALALFSAHAEEETIPWPKLRALAAEYLEKCADKAEVAKHVKKLNGVVEQRMIDGDTLSEDSVLRSVMLDWAASNSKKIIKRDQKCIAQACHFFVVFVDKGYDMPGVIRSELTPKVIAEIMEYLEKQIATAK